MNDIVITYLFNKKKLLINKYLGSLKGRAQHPLYY